MEKISTIVRKRSTSSSAVTLRTLKVPSAHALFWDPPRIVAIEGIVDLCFSVGPSKATTLSRRDLFIFVIKRILSIHATEVTGIV